MKKGCEKEIWVSDFDKGYKGINKRENCITCLLVQFNMLKIDYCIYQNNQMLPIGQLEDQPLTELMLPPAQPFLHRQQQLGYHGKVVLPSLEEEMNAPLLMHKEKAE